jgi:hypothetical protein
MQDTDYNTTASGSNSVITLNAVANEYNVLDWVTWSYATAPTSGGLTIVDSTNNTTLLAADITASGPGQLVFGDRGMVAPISTEVTITLLDGTAAKKLTVQKR